MFSLYDVTDTSNKYDEPSESCYPWNCYPDDSCSPDFSSCQPNEVRYPDK